MKNKDFAKSMAAAREADRQRQVEKEAKKPLVIDRIATCGNYSDEEKDLIYLINEDVMSVDGTAEQWGGYSFNPLDYVETSCEIFDMAKKFFTDQKGTQ